MLAESEVEFNGEFDVEDKINAEAEEKARALSRLVRARSSETIPEETIKHSTKEDIRLTLFESAQPYPHPQDFQRVVITETGDPLDEDTVSACKLLSKCIELRNKWMSSQPFPPQDSLSSNEYLGLIQIDQRKRMKTDAFRRRCDIEYSVFDRQIPPSAKEFSFEMVKGVMHVYVIKEDQNESSTSNFVETDFSLGRKRERDGGPINSPSPNKEAPLSNGSVNIFPVPSYEEFVKDFLYVSTSVNSGPVKTISYRRLGLLASLFGLHIVLNETRESDAQKSVPHKDFYNVRKVDTHVHHSACMNQKHLLRFIKSKLKRYPDEVVIYRDGRFLTLGEVFKSLNLTAYDLSIDTLDMHANNTFHRFDRFNLKYNPAGQSRLREIFLKTDNLIAGRYLAEITQEVISDLEASKYQLVEWRISIYGRKASEWEQLANWFFVNKLAHKNVRWLIQIPRLFHVYRKGGELRSFSQMLQNIFNPLFQVTINPSSCIPLHYFLLTVVGIDSVDDESRPEHGQLGRGPVESIPSDPEDWNMPENPPYGYWMYFMYANICVLNQLRAARGLNTFQFRPHCGESGDTDHLVSTFLVANQINHGIMLRKNPGLQYLYFMAQIGIAMSPLSNNRLFLDFNKNPFLKYFQQGLNVSLSTDDPLMFHNTKDPLVEEYSIAAQVWKLSSTDLCEIARNSVLQSGWEAVYKRHFLGESDEVPYADIAETNVPEIRLRYRRETLERENLFLLAGAKGN